MLFSELSVEVLKTATVETTSGIAELLLLVYWLWHEHRTQPTITIPLHLKNSARNSLLPQWEDPLCSQAYCATVIKFLLNFCIQ